MRCAGTHTLSLTRPPLTHRGRRRPRKAPKGFIASTSSRAPLYRPASVHRKNRPQNDKARPHAAASVCVLTGLAYWLPAGRNPQTFKSQVMPHGGTVNFYAVPGQDGTTLECAAHVWRALRSTQAGMSGDRPTGAGLLLREPSAGLGLQPTLKLLWTPAFHHRAWQHQAVRPRLRWASGLVRFSRPVRGLQLWL